MQAFEATSQTGALIILQKGADQIKRSLDLRENRAMQLSRLYVRISRNTKPLSELFPNFTHADALDLLCNKDISLELEEIIKKKAVLEFSENLTEPDQLYIPRSISNRLILDPKVFRMECFDVFVFKGIERGALAKLIRPFAARSSVTQRSLVTSRHIYLDDDEDWEDLEFVCESPLHLICKEECGFVLQKTTKVTDVLQHNVSTESKSKKAFIPEDSFVDQLVSDYGSQGALICDVPGMGKTWLMQSLAFKLYAKLENCIVFFINLAAFGNKLCHVISELSDNIIKTQALQLVLDFACTSRLAFQLMHRYAISSWLKMMFVFDGYDEINQASIDCITLILVTLSKLENVQILVSSRPNMRTALQKTFNIISYDILPFGKDEQVNCVVGQWLKVCPRSGFQNLSGLAKQCIDSVKNIQNEDIHDILGVPLKCLILATVNEKQAVQLCKPKRRRPIQISELVTVTSVFDLYETFVNTLVVKVAGNLSITAKEDFFNEVSKFHTYMSLELLFPEIAPAYYSYLARQITGRSFESIVKRVGVAGSTNGELRLELIHRSFAEYFVGRFFADFWNNIEQYSTDFVKKIGIFFIQNVMETNLKLDEKTWDDVQASINFLPGSYAHFMTYDKLCHLKHSNILWFMNSTYRKNKLQNQAQSFRNAIISNYPVTECDSENTVIDDNKDDVLTKFKGQLIEFAFIRLIACIDDRVTSVLSLMVQILKCFFEEAERPKLLSVQEPFIEELDFESGAAWLLCRVAMSNDPGNAVEVFKLFENDSDENVLLNFCEFYPHKYWSPLEVAIRGHDLDMIGYFEDKVKPPLERLFSACFLHEDEYKYSLPNINADVLDQGMKTVERVFDTNDKLLRFLRLQEIDHTFRNRIQRYPCVFQIRLFTAYIEKFNRRYKTINLRNKQFFIEEALRESTDIEMVNMFLSLFGKSGKETRVIVATSKDTQTDFFTAEEVLHALDLDETKEVFSQVLLPFAEALENCSSVETLKVLLGIKEDFSSCNKQKRNYLHYATINGNMDWVKYLVNSGCFLNQTDEQGHTSLFCSISCSMHVPNLRVLQLLVEKGADVDVMCGYNMSNLAHALISKWPDINEELISSWILYLLHTGHKQLFQSKDKNGVTPYDMLAKTFGENHPLTLEVVRRLHEEKAPVAGSSSRYFSRHTLAIIIISVMIRYLQFATEVNKG